MRSWLTILIIIACGLVVKANHIAFEFTPLHQEAYDYITSLRFEEGEKVVEKIKITQPSNKLVYLIEDYLDFLTIFINEEKEEFKEREKNKDLRLNAIKEGDKNDPYYLFAQAEIHLHWALSRLKFGEYLTAAVEINKAMGMLEKNQNLFPDFISNKKSLSALHAAAGTIPDRYKGIIGLISNFEGSIQQGLKEINEVIASSDSENYIFYKEALAIKTMILMHLANDKTGAWEFLKKQQLNYKENPILSFLYANAATHAGQNDMAVSILSERIKSPRYASMHYLDLMLGNALLSKLDPSADVYIKSFLQHFKGENYIKDGYRKLAWYELVINNDRMGYLKNMEKCASSGHTLFDEDKAADEEAYSGIVPNKDLLKARILFDGGYGEKALAVINRIGHNSLTDEEKLEFLYRKGRVLQELQNHKEALEVFRECIDQGQSSRRYFACNAALQSGIILEESGKYNEAKSSFELCLSMNPNEYRNSLHQKAKSGLIRLKERGN